MGSRAVCGVLTECLLLIDLGNSLDNKFIPEYAEISHDFYEDSRKSWELFPGNSRIDKKKFSRIGYKKFFKTGHMKLSRKILQPL